MTDIEKIKTKVKELYDDVGIGHGKGEAYLKVIDIIDALPEEPVSEGLEEEIDKYTNNQANYLEYSDGWSDLTDIEYIEKAARHFVNWQKEQTINKACDAYCLICGHYPHSVPTYICRQDCQYYKDFRKTMKDEQ